MLFLPHVFCSLSDKPLTSCGIQKTNKQTPKKCECQQFLVIIVLEAMPGGIPMNTASLNAINKKKRERERESAIQATLVIGGEMGEHERELHG
jgi:hypothetical protein